MIEFRGKPDAASIRGVMLLNFIRTSRDWKIILHALFLLLLVGSLAITVYNMLTDSNQSARSWIGPILVRLSVLFVFATPYRLLFQMADQAAKSPAMDGYIDYQGVTLKTSVGETCTRWQNIPILVESDDLMGLFTDDGVLIVLQRGFFATESLWQAARDTARPRVVPPE